MEERLYHLDRLQKRIDAIIRERPSHKEILEFLREVMTEQYKVRPKIKTESGKIGEEEYKGLMEGFPLLNKRDLPLDMASATILFKRLCKVLSRSKRGSGDSKSITQALRRKDMDLAELFRQAGAENGEYVSTLSKRLGVREDLLFFLAENSIKPILKAYADELKGNVDQEAWWKGYCPICGSPPFIAKFLEEGERFLICSSCSFEWRFMRLTCPFCENEDHKALKYFYSEREGKTTRVDVCDKCGRYIKGVDVQALGGEFIPIVEDLGSLYLDVIAQKEGYEREGTMYRVGVI